MGTIILRPQSRPDARYTRGCAALPRCYDWRMTQGAGLALLFLYLIFICCLFTLLVAVLALTIHATKRFRRAVLIIDLVIVVVAIGLVIFDSELTFLSLTITAAPLFSLCFLAIEAFRSNSLQRQDTCGQSKRRD